MSTQDTPRRNPRIAVRIVDEKALIVIVDKKRLHTLNAVGTRVWQLCDGRSVGEIADALASEYAIDVASALDDVRQFVAELRQIGALMVGDEAAP